MKLQHLSVLLIYLLSCMQSLAAPTPDQGLESKGVIAADLNSDLAAMYRDAYLKTWNAYENAYQSLYNQYLNYFLTHRANLKRKRTDLLINESMVFPRSLFSISPFAFITPPMSQSPTGVVSEPIKSNKT